MDSPSANAASVAVVIDPLLSEAAPPERRLYELFAERLRGEVLPKVEVSWAEETIASFCAAAAFYRVALFAWADRVPSSLRLRLRQWVEQEGHVGIWFHAPGLMDETGPSLAHCQELTGITVNADPMSNGLEVALTSFDHPFTTGLQTQPPFGSGQGDRDRFRPHYYADDGVATTLGRLVGSDKPGLAVKRVGRGRSVYFAAPLPHPELLRRICLAARVDA